MGRPDIVRIGVLFPLWTLITLLTPALIGGVAMQARQLQNDTLTRRRRALGKPEET